MLRIKSCSRSDSVKDLFPKFPSFVGNCTPISAFQFKSMVVVVVGLPHKATRNVKDLILKFCHSFQDTASPLAT